MSFNQSLVFQIPCEQVFGPTNTSCCYAFRGSKDLLTRYLVDFGRLGNIFTAQKSIVSRVGVDSFRYI